MGRAKELSWYRTREVLSGVWLIAEPSHVNTWLVEGTEGAALLDTGLGIVPIRPIAENISSVPLQVINTHHHFDHTGGNHEFDRIAIHELGAESLQQTWPASVLHGYYQYTLRMLCAVDSYRRLDRQFFHLLGAESEPVPLPDGFEPSQWVIRPSEATRILTDGDVIELGERNLHVLHTPGHSPDSICLLDEGAGLLFAGDTINTGPIYAHFSESNLEAFHRSVHRLAELEGDIRYVMVHHFGRALVEPRFLREVAEGFDRVLTTALDMTLDHDCIDGPVLRASFDRFSIFLPDPASPSSPLTTD